MKERKYSAWKINARVYLRSGNFLGTPDFFCMLVSANTVQN